MNGKITGFGSFDGNSGGIFGNAEVTVASPKATTTKFSAVATQNLSPVSQDPVCYDSSGNIKVPCTYPGAILSSLAIHVPANSGWDQQKINQAQGAASQTMTPDVVTQFEDNAIEAHKCAQNGMGYDPVTGQCIQLTSQAASKLQQETLVEQQQLAQQKAYDSTTRPAIKTFPTSDDIGDITGCPAGMAFNQMTGQCEQPQLDSGFYQDQGESQPECSWYQAIDEVGQCKTKTSVMVGGAVATIVLAAVGYKLFVK